MSLTGRPECRKFTPNIGLWSAHEFIDWSCMQVMPDRCAYWLEAYLACCKLVANFALDLTQLDFLHNQTRLSLNRSLPSNRKLQQDWQEGIGNSQWPCNLNLGKDNKKIDLSLSWFDLNLPTNWYIFVFNSAFDLTWFSTQPNKVKLKHALHTDNHTALVRSVFLHNQTRSN